jgi:protoheme ferro-lyase
MRTWRPFIAEAIEAAVRAGVDDLVALPLAPQYSRLSVGKYRDAVLKAAPAACASAS